MKSYW